MIGYRPEIFVFILLASAATGCATDQMEPTSSTTYSYRCDGADAPIVVILNGDRGHLFAKQASQSIQREPASGAYVGADVYYRPDDSAGSTPGQQARILVKGKAFDDCSNDAPAAVWEAAKLQGFSYRAIGQEPPWILGIHRDQGFVLSTGYESTENRFPYTEPESNAAERSSRFDSELNGEHLSITIKGESCRDSMSGEAFSSRVTVEWRGQTLNGCGRALH